MLTEPQGIDFSRLFSSLDIASRRTAIAAVSGGSDSTALLLLLKQHLDRSVPRTRLVAVTVDHALRAESAAEAVQVGRLCARLGITHRVLRWTGAKPASGLAAAAREARHELLAQAARAEQTDLVLTGHTANDQAETVLMRQARRDAADGGRGLAGMAPATLFGGRIWFARPLLDTRRDVLREFLTQKGVEWFDDSTNVNQQYERPRIRRQLAETDGDTAIATALEVAARAGRERLLLGQAAADLIRTHVHRPAPGLLRLQPGFFEAEATDAALYALRILLAVAGGAAHLPDEARSGALLARIAAGEPGRSALSRVLVERRKAGVFLLREARDLPDRTAVRDGMTWDGRYRIRPAPSGLEREFPAGARGSPEAAPEGLVRLAAATLPVLSPTLTAVPVPGPWARYLPSFDVLPARAVANLIGARDIPEPPFGEHD